MKQSTITKENKNYKKINFKTKSNLISPNNELRVISSIKRILTKSNEINKVFFDTKATPQELSEQLVLVTDEIINVFYDMELAILSEGAVPLIMGEKLSVLKAIISLSKIQLCQPGLNEVCFPESFIEEYSLLLERTNKAILAVKTRIDKVKTIEKFDPLKEVIEKNLLKLNMLRMHYITALGLPDTN